MEKAKAAISDFMSKSGKHDTTVHETVAPAVQNETVKPTRHENITTATDREVHQDHYHTSVQPVHDREVLPEVHRHNMAPVEHRHHEHGNDAEVSQRLATEAAQFKDTSVTHDTKHTQAVQPTVAGEHIHHHVHETIQPVVHKETVQPEVVHTTVPIHEVHHNAAQHHSASALPALSMSEFKSQGGVLSGREEKYDGFEGQPKSIGKNLGGIGSHGHHQEGLGSSTATGGAVRGTGASSGLDQPLEGRTGASGTGLNSGVSSSGTGVNSGLNSGVPSSGINHERV